MESVAKVFKEEKETLDCSGRKKKRKSPDGKRGKSDTESGER